MPTLFNLDDEDRKVPASYLDGLPDEFIRPAVIAGMETRIANLRQALEKIINIGEGNPNQVLIQAHHMTIIGIARKALELDK